MSEIRISDRFEKMLFTPLTPGQVQSTSSEEVHANALSFSDRFLFKKCVKRGREDNE